MDSVRTLPRHVGVIMDGNGRWASKRGLPRSAGHTQGVVSFERFCKYCRKIGIPFVTVYAFSTENWRRPRSEVDGVMVLLKSYLKRALKNKDEHARICFIGDRTPLSPEIREMMGKLEEKSKHETDITVTIAVNYGGREELLHAAKALAQQCLDNRLTPDSLTVNDIGKSLYTANLPDVDLLIRTGGEQRTSNFLPWQSIYAEWVFSQVLWPDFSESDLDSALMQYHSRERRFGGVGKEGSS